jgi:hypothetical protein
MTAFIFSLPYTFPHSFPVCRIFQFNLAYQSCPVAQFLSQPVAQGHLRNSQGELLVLFLSLQTLNLFIEKKKRHHPQWCQHDDIPARLQENNVVVPKGC